MADLARRRPDGDEHLPYYGQYIAKVPDGDILELLASNIEETSGVMGSMSTEVARRRPAPDEWSALDITLHLSDTERLFANRAFRFARMDPSPLAGYEPNDYAAAANANRRSIEEVVEEFRAVRAGTLTLFRSFDDSSWQRRGIASGAEVSVRALAWIVAGHEIHHLVDLRQFAAGAT